MCQSAFLTSIIHYPPFQRYYWRFTLRANYRVKAINSSKYSSRRGIPIQCCFYKPQSKTCLYTSNFVSLELSRNEFWMTVVQYPRTPGPALISQPTLILLESVTHHHDPWNHPPSGAIPTLVPVWRNSGLGKLGNLFHKTTQLNEKHCDSSPGLFVTKTLPVLAMFQFLCYSGLSIHHFSC